MESKQISAHGCQTLEAVNEGVAEISPSLPPESECASSFTEISGLDIVPEGHPFAQEPGVNLTEEGTTSIGSEVIESASISVLRNGSHVAKYQGLYSPDNTVLVTNPLGEDAEEEVASATQVPQTEDLPTFSSSNQCEANHERFLTVHDVRCLMETTMFPHAEQVPVSIDKNDQTNTVMAASIQNSSSSGNREQSKSMMMPPQTNALNFDNTSDQFKVDSPVVIRGDSSESDLKYVSNIRETGDLHIFDCLDNFYESNFADDEDDTIQLGGAFIDHDDELERKSSEGLGTIVTKRGRSRPSFFPCISYEDDLDTLREHESSTITSQVQVHFGTKSVSPSHTPDVAFDLAISQARELRVIKANQRISKNLGKRARVEDDTSDLEEIDKATFMEKAQIIGKLESSEGSDENPKDTSVICKEYDTEDKELSQMSFAQQRQDIIKRRAVLMKRQTEENIKLACQMEKNQMDLNKRHLKENRELDRKIQKDLKTLGKREKKFMATLKRTKSASKGDKTISDRKEHYSRKKSKTPIPISSATIDADSDSSGMFFTEDEPITSPKFRDSITENPVSWPSSNAARTRSGTRSRCRKSLKSVPSQKKHSHKPSFRMRKLGGMFQGCHMNQNTGDSSDEAAEMRPMEEESDEDDSRDMYMFGSRGVHMRGGDLDEAELANLLHEAEEHEEDYPENAAKSSEDAEYTPQSSIQDHASHAATVRALPWYQPGFDKVEYFKFIEGSGLEFKNFDTVLDCLREKIFKSTASMDRSGDNATKPTFDQFICCLNWHYKRIKPSRQLSSKREEENSKERPLTRKEMIEPLRTGFCLVPIPNQTDEESCHSWIKQNAVTLNIHNQHLLRAVDYKSKGRLIKHHGFISQAPYRYLSTKEERLEHLKNHADFRSRYATPMISTTKNPNDMEDYFIEHKIKRQKKDLRDPVVQVAVINPNTSVVPILSMMAELTYYGAPTEMLLKNWYKDEYIWLFRIPEEQIVMVYDWSEIQHWMKNRGTEDIKVWNNEVAAPAFRKHEQMRKAHVEELVPHPNAT